MTDWTPKPSRRGRIAKAIALPTAVVLLLLCCCGGAALSYLLGGFDESGDPYAIGANGEIMNAYGALPQTNQATPEQVRNAAIIIMVGQKMKVPPRGWVIAVATARQESWLRNLDHLGSANDHDSLGLFQQRPSSGWGSPGEIKNPEYAARKFYEKLLKVDGWQTMSLTAAAQAVQISAYPYAYQDDEPVATHLVNLLTKGTARAPGSRYNGIAASGWTSPVAGKVTSGFLGARPNHYGIDFPVPRNTPIRATATGIVTTVLCNAPGWGCDQDGSPSVPGCGWYVDIGHAGGILTRYCHMNRRPEVTVGQQVTTGQVIGYVGSTGNSSGPHLHFEVHTGGGTGNSSAVNPMTFLREAGVAVSGGDS